MLSRFLTAFILRRLAASIVVLVGVSMLTFILIHVAPGGAAQTLAGQFATPERLAAIREKYGLDDPLPVQYWRFLRDAVQLDFGRSLTTREPVLQAMLARLDITAPLVLVSFTCAAVLGTALGTVAAYRKNTPLDRALVGLSMGPASSPIFATATIVLVVFGLALGWLPVFGSGEGEGLASRVTHLVLPVLTLTLFGTGAMLKITRARVTEVLEEDYRIFAESRGLSWRYLVSRVVLRNAGIVVVTQWSIILLAIVGSEILVEEIFSLNGLGVLFLEAVVQRDIPLVQGIVLLLTAFIVLVNLVVDLLYFALDPRVGAHAKVQA